MLQCTLMFDRCDVLYPGAWRVGGTRVWVSMCDLSSAQFMLDAVYISYGLSFVCFEKKER